MNKGFNVEYLEKDEKYPLEVLDFNSTTIKVKLKTNNAKVFGEEVPLRIWKYNQTLDEEFSKDVLLGKVARKDLASDYKKIYSKVREENLRFSFFNNEKEITYEFSIDEILEFGPHSTTILLYDNETENTADLMYLDWTYSLPNWYFGSQTKWNITSVPSGSLIDSSTICFYIYSKSGSPDNDVVVWRVDDQDWTESISLSGLQNQDLDTQTSSTLSSTSSGTNTCFDVTDIISEDYTAGNKNSSLRFEDPDYLTGTITNIDVATGPLWIGSWSNSFHFYSRESSVEWYYKPMLEIRYSPETKSGLVSTTTGATPFYTTSYNPTTVNLDRDESSVVILWVNVTGTVDSVHEFFAYANLSSDGGVSNVTNSWDVTIV